MINLIFMAAFSFGSDLSIDEIAKQLDAVCEKEVDYFVCMDYFINCSVVTYKVTTQQMVDKCVNKRKESNK